MPAQLSSCYDGSVFIKTIMKSPSVNKATCAIKQKNWGTLEKELGLLTSKMLFWARMCQFLTLSWIFFLSIGNLYRHVNFRLIYLWKQNVRNLPMLPYLSFSTMSMESWPFPSPTQDTHHINSHVCIYVYLYPYHVWTCITFLTLYLYVYIHFHANVQTTVWLLKSQKEEAYWTHFVNLLSFHMSKQLKPRWCEGKWFTEEIWDSFFRGNYIVQIPVIGLLFWRRLGPCGCHKLPGLWHLTRGDLLWEQPLSRLHCKSAPAGQAFFCRLPEHFVLAWKVFIAHPLKAWLVRNLDWPHVIANKE